MTATRRDQLLAAIGDAVASSAASAHTGFGPGAIMMAVAANTTDHKTTLSTETQKIGDTNAKLIAKNPAFKLFKIIYETAAEDVVKVTNRLTEYYDETPELNATNSDGESAFSLACRINPAAAWWIIQKSLEKSGDPNYKGSPLNVNTIDRPGNHPLTYLVSYRLPIGTPAEREQKYRAELAAKATEKDFKMPSKDEIKATLAEQEIPHNTAAENDARRAVVFSRLLPLVAADEKQIPHLGKALVQTIIYDHKDHTESLLELNCTFKDEDLRDAAAAALKRGNDVLVAQLYEKQINKVAGMWGLLNFSNDNNINNLLKLAAPLKGNADFKKTSIHDPSQVSVSIIQTITHAYAQGRLSYPHASNAMTTLMQEYQITPVDGDFLPLLAKGSAQAISLWNTAVHAGTGHVGVTFTISETCEDTKTETNVANTIKLSNLIFAIINKNLTGETIDELKAEFKIDPTEVMSFTSQASRKSKTFPGLNRNKLVRYNALDFAVACGDIEATKASLTRNLFQRFNPPSSFTDYVIKTYGVPRKGRKELSNRAHYLIKIYQAVIGQERLKLFTLIDISELKKRSEDVNFFHSIFKGKNLEYWREVCKQKNLPVPAAPANDAKTEMVISDKRSALFNKQSMDLLVSAAASLSQANEHFTRVTQAFSTGTTATLIQTDLDVLKEVLAIAKTLENKEVKKACVAYLEYHIERLATPTESATATATATAVTTVAAPK